MSSPSSGLPNTLLLLVHLHILEYPHTNQPEYDSNLFNPQTRGLRDRLKSMEDITYFMVSKLERQVKSVLSTYPCAQPSDSVAFRASLSKYLETLRHQAIRGAQTPGTSTGADLAWWWKDIVVRKSLLEECSGSRFERLLISLSTHVLFKLSTSLTPERVTAALRSQPEVYTSLLASSRFTSRRWATTASLLLQQQDHTRALRERLLDGAHSEKGRYEKLSTEKLIVLSNSSVQDAVLTHWNGENDVFSFLLDLAGLRVANLNSSDTDNDNPCLHEPEKSDRAPTLPVQPLPVAAAHHPFSLRKLRKSIFSTKNNAKTSHSPAGASTAENNHASLVLAPAYDLEKALSHVLANALLNAQKVSEELASGLKQLQTIEASRIVKPRRDEAPTLKLWDPPLCLTVNFDTRPTPELLAAHGLQVTEDQSEEDIQRALDNKVEHVRKTLLPQFPPPLKAPPPPPEPPTSKLPRLGTRGAPGASSAATRDQQASHTATWRTQSSMMVPTTSTLQTPKRRRQSRKSVRFSVARRPSLFPNIQDEEIDNILDLVHDSSDSDSDFGAQDRTRSMLYDATPRPVRRLGSPAKGGMDSVLSSRKKLSFQIPPEPMRRLPSLASGMLSDMEDGDEEDEDDELSARRISQTSSSNASEYYTEEYEDAPSMTLRDILLRTEENGELLMDEDRDDDDLGLEDESFDWS